MIKNGFVIGAATSGSGKTTLSLGLLRSLSRRGVRVQPFKCGPDYIDTMFHRAACGISSVNLDLFMSTEEYMRSLARRYSSSADCIVVEGAMGLYDGFERSIGSTAHVATTLGLPVVLVVNAKASAFSTGALIHGFATFPGAPQIAGVVFNNVGSAKHLSSLREAASAAGVECFGGIPRDAGLQAPSRHLGLSITGREEMERFISRAADLVAENIDIDALLKGTEPAAVEEPAAAAERRIVPFRRIAVARDDAFNFIYEGNMDAWRRSEHEGCRVELCFFSPLNDSHVPEGADFIYLPGGYPELFADRLSANGAMRASIAGYVAQGGAMLAECGGMIYLCRDLDGVPLCDVLPMSCTMENSRLHLGYREAELPGGLRMRGHEFHYSRLRNPDALRSIGVQKDARGNKVDTPIYRVGNVIAGYTHLYWGEKEILQFWNR